MRWAWRVSSATVLSWRRVIGRRWRFGIHLTGIDSIEGYKNGVSVHIGFRHLGDMLGFVTSARKYLDVEHGADFGVTVARYVILSQPPVHTSPSSLRPPTFIISVTLMRYQYHLPPVEVSAWCFFSTSSKDPPSS